MHLPVTKLGLGLSETARTTGVHQNCLAFTRPGDSLTCLSDVQLGLPSSTQYKINRWVFCVFLKSRKFKQQPSLLTHVNHSEKRINKNQVFFSFKYLTNLPHLWQTSMMLSTDCILWLIMQFTWTLSVASRMRWLIHVNVWQKPLQYCKEISLQLIKINEKKFFLKRMRWPSLN